MVIVMGSSMQLPIFLLESAGGAEPGMGVCEWEGPSRLEQPAKGRIANRGPVEMKVLYTGTHTHFGHQETAVSCIDGIIRCGNVAKGTA